MANILWKVLRMLVVFLFQRPDKEWYKCKKYDEEKLLIVTSLWEKTSLAPV